MGLLDNKKGLILNIANDRSIATYIASNAIKEGGKCGFGFLPMDNPEKSQRRVRKAMEENGFGAEWLYPCDVSSDESIEKFFAGVREQFGTIDFVVHSLAFANRDYLKIGNGHKQWSDLLDKYRFDLVLCTADSPLASLLRLHGDWKTVEDDGSAVLFRLSKKP